MIILVHFALSEFLKNKQEFQGLINSKGKGKVRGWGLFTALKPYGLLYS
jgi:hypothetical protein